MRTMRKVLGHIYDHWGRIGVMVSLYSGYLGIMEKIMDTTSNSLSGTCGRSTLPEATRKDPGKDRA